MLVVSMTRPELASPSQQLRAPNGANATIARDQKGVGRPRVRSECQIGICRQPRYPRPLFGTGGFASPSFDGFAKTSARSVRRRPKSTHLYLLRYCCCSCSCLTLQQFPDEREHARERAAIGLQNRVSFRDHFVAMCSTRQQIQHGRGQLRC